MIYFFIVQFAYHVKLRACPPFWIACHVNIAACHAFYSAYHVNYSLSRKYWYNKFLEGVGSEVRMCTLPILLPTPLISQGVGSFRRILTLPSILPTPFILEGVDSDLPTPLILQGEGNIASIAPISPTSYPPLVKTYYINI